MEAICLVTDILLLSLVIGCQHQTQPTPHTRQNTQQNAQAPAPEAQPSAAKSERGTPAEAKAMLQRAVAHYTSVGRKQALADFTGKKPPFADRDLYVVCIGSNHTITANGGFPQYVGQSADLLKDADSKSVGGAIWETASSKGEGAVEYRWYNPVSKKIEPKVLFVRKVGDDACGVGAYNPR